MKNKFSESEIAKRFQCYFHKHKDFSVVQEKALAKGSKLLRFDIVISYAEKPLAVIEIKKVDKTSRFMNALKNHLQIIYDTRYAWFCIALVEGKYYYYDHKEKDLCIKSEEDIYEMLLNGVYEGSHSCDEMITPFKKAINKYNNWSEYIEILCKYIKKGALKRFGNSLFLDDKSEKDLMKELLWFNSDYNKDSFCRYTSAKSFFLSLEGKFRLSSSEAMNDELETKVINDYDNLKLTSDYLASHLYNGFFMCFSADTRCDKLFNWYMYGDRARGVCFEIEPNDSENKECFFAPVVYITKKKDNDRHDLLSFLNDLVGWNIDGKYKFELRNWHFWKFFFKYDFYKEEEEIRLLIIQKKDGKFERSEEYGGVYQYIERDLNELPFTINRVVLGPKCTSNQLLKHYIYDRLSTNCLEKSEICGYR